MNAKPIELYTYTTPAQRRRAFKIKIIRNLFLFALALMASTAIMAVVVPAVLDAAERESQWRKERLCRIYGVCDPKAGP